MFSWTASKNTANYYKNQKTKLLTLVDSNIEIFESILTSRNATNMKGITRKYNKAHDTNLEILHRITELQIQFKKTIIALPVSKSIPNSVKTYITISNNKYKFIKFPKVKHMFQILTNLKGAKTNSNTINANNARKAKEAKEANNAFAAKAKEANNLKKAKEANNLKKAKEANNKETKAITNAASLKSLQSLAEKELSTSKALKTELNNSMKKPNLAVTNTVRSMLGTNGSGAVPPNNTTKHNNLSGLN